MLAIGAHVDPADPLAAGVERQADVVQFFLADPQGWTAPVPREDAEELRAADTAVYVHAPYVLNLATTNNRIRMPSRKLLGQHAAGAAAIGSAGLIVHGGHVNAGEDLQVGFDNWRKAFRRTEPPLPVLIENTAGGDSAMARRLENLARLWDALDGFDVGFCLDTCHAHAAGEELVDLVDRVLAVTGRIDLVHANDSRDPFGSGRDRHTNLGTGAIDSKLLVAVVEAAGAPVVVETPGGVAGQAADIAFLRAHLPA